MIHLRESDVSDHYEPRLPTMLVAAFCVVCSVFVGALLVGVVYVMRGM